MLYKNTELHNVVELLKEDTRNFLTRIPDKLRLSLNKQALASARAAAGCEIRFNLKSKEAKVVLSSPVKDGVAEVYQGNFLKSTHFITKEPTSIHISLPAKMDLLKTLSQERGLPFDAGLTRVVLPYKVIQIIDIEGEFELPTDSQIPKVNYLAYGSSITHGADALSPSGTYIMRTAERLGVNLFNLGFGGGAHYEEQMADYIASRQDWDFLSCEMGINMVGSFEVEEFQRRVNYFIDKIVTSHPNKPIFCIDMFKFYRDVDKISDDKHTQFRKVVKDVVGKVNSDKVIHFDGTELLQSVTGLTFDLLHPSPMGMEEISLNLTKSIQPYLKGLLQK